ncbi:MAG: thiopurine S-methyltransferase [Gammaproteobacteria bacterium]|nr:thiopurine S-methyltransferase [Gammaproteobacteria bacterium]
MDGDFWRERWRSNEIGFHQPDYNKWLLKYWRELHVPRGSDVFVPLCGKSRDLYWLLQRGYRVQGVELVEQAIEAFFEENDLRARRDTRGRFGRFTVPNAEILCGDFFELTVNHLNTPVAVFDRAALVALPEKLRFRYADHLLRIIPDGAQILLVTLEYPQDQVSGPPFSVSREEVTVHFEERCGILRFESAKTDVVPPKFRAQGLEQVVETIYHLVKER